MHPSNWARLIGVLTAVVFTATCTSTKEVRGVNLRQEFGNDLRQVVAFTSVDGGQHDFSGGGEVRGEELLLHRRQAPVEGADRSSSSGDPDALATEYRLPLAQVSMVEVQYTSGWKTAGLAAGIIVGVVLIVGIVAASSAKGLSPSFAASPTSGPPSMANPGVALSFERHPARAGAGAPGSNPGLAPGRER
jgi:hypothetical protein